MRIAPALVVAIVLASAARAQDEVTRVFVFAGQSNMVGSDSHVEDVRRFPAFVGLEAPQPAVRFAYVLGREDKTRSDGWVELQPVNGVVGPELSFAREVRRHVDTPLAIIKVAAGGTHLGGDWNPDAPSGFELYPLLLETVRESLAALERDGVPYRLEGFVWHQGENDMFDEGYLANYGANLANFVASVRRDLDAPELRFYVGELCTKTVWGMDLRPRMHAISVGQKAVAAADPRVDYVPTSHVGVEIGRPYGLHYHYGTLGQLEHGVNHARAYLAHIGVTPEARAPLATWPLAAGSNVRLFVLAGHRNMEGERAFVQELAALPGGAALREPDARIPFKYSTGGGVQTSDGWEPLGPAGLYDTFGPEVRFGATLRRELDAPIAIAKFTHSGSQVIDWTPEGSVAVTRNLYPAFLAFVREAIAELEARGHTVELAGVLYHVGENDMSFGPFRRAAPAHVRALIEASRRDLGLPELRWFVSQQPPTEHADLNAIDVTAGLAQLAADDPRCVHVKAFDLPPQAAPLVLDTAGVVALGERLARAVLALDAPPRAPDAQRGSRPPEDDPAPVTGGAARIAAWERHVALTAAAPDTPTWRSVGPKHCGGRIEAIDSPRGQPEVIYVGVGSGGVWKSSDAGRSWRHVFARESTFAIGDVTVDPNDGDVVWVGTGEAHLGGMSYDGTGVFRSSDGGATWRNMGLADSARIGKVLVDPRDSRVIHVAVIGPRRGAYAGRGVHVSRDGGETWTQTLLAGDEVGVIDLVRDPFDGDRLWAAAWDRARGGRGGVFRSDDGGATWQRLAGGLLTGTDVGRVAVAASASERGVVYALVVDHSPPGEGRYDVGGALFRSDDGGDTWVRTSEQYVDTYVGWDFCDVMVSPDDADEVYVCGLRLMVSRDGGATFARGGEEVARVLEHPGQGMHLDMHDLWIDPADPDRVLLGTDGGLYVSQDRARTWLHLNTLPIAEFYTVHVDRAEPSRIWGGTQDNASLSAPITARLRDGAPDDWSYVFLDAWDGGDGFATFPDSSGDGTVYYEQQNGDMYRKHPGALLQRTRGSGRRITPRAQEGDPPLRFGWNTPLFESVHGAGVLYCASQYVLRSDDRGDTWERVSEDLTGGRGALTALVESPLDPLRLTAGHGRGGVSLTSDGGRTWRAAGAGLPRRELQRLALSPHDSSRVFACLSGVDGGDYRAYVYRSDDFGATWAAIDGGLPAAPANVVLEDPAQPGRLYVGTDLGVYTSADGGATWSSLSRGMPTAPVLDLALDMDSATLVAVTHGLSAFAIDVATLRE